MEVSIIFLVVFVVIVLQGPLLKCYNYLYEKRNYKLFFVKKMVNHAIVSQHLNSYKSEGLS
jgi:hypothetical protein